MLRLLILYILAILFFSLAGDEIPIWLSGAIVLTLLGLIFYLWPCAYRRWRGWLVNLLWFASSLIWLQVLSLLQQQRLPPEGELVKTVIELEEYPRKGGKRYRCRAQFHWWSDDHRGEGRLMLYLPKGSQPGDWFPGLRLTTKLRFYAPPAQRNPFAFDYRQFLARKGIHRQAFLSAKDPYSLLPSDQKSVRQRAALWQGHFVKLLKQWPLDQHQEAVAAALLVGNRKEISAEQRKNYSASGLSHLLAVSGLHVGIFYMVSGYLLFWLGKGRRAERIRYLLIFLALWGYALLTGLSPSVLRAVTMFSFFALARVLGRRASVYHTLFCSALFLLLVNPQFLFSVGFQLSYLAVLAIVSLVPLGQPFWQPRWRALRWLRDLCLVSIAAQIGTAPLAVYYFHQFPLGFLLSNLLALPLITLIMYLALPALVLQALGLSLPWLWQACAWGLSLLEKEVALMMQFPDLLLQDLSFTSLQVIALYSFIGLLAFWYVYGGLAKLRLTLGVLLILLFTEIGQRIDQSLHREKRQFWVGAQKVEVLRSGRKCYLKKEPYIDTAQFNYGFEAYRIHQRIVESQWVDPQSTSGKLNAY